MIFHNFSGVSMSPWIIVLACLAWKLQIHADPEELGRCWAPAATVSIGCRTWCAGGAAKLGAAAAHASVEPRGKHGQTQHQNPNFHL